MKLTMFVILSAVLLAEAASAQNACVEVEIGDDKASGFGCLNQTLEEKVQSIRPPENIPPLGNTSPTVRLGGFNQTALRQQYGPNFGKSAVPYRPARTYGRALAR